VLYGIYGLFAYLAVLASALTGVVLRYRATASPWIQSSIWALVAGMMGLLTAFWSVSLFGQTISLLYVMLGLHGAFAADTLRAPASFAPGLNQYSRLRDVCQPSAALPPSTQAHMVPQPRHA
jgi:hypothetical protein